MQGGQDELLAMEKRLVVINRLHQILEPFMLRRQVGPPGWAPPLPALLARGRRLRRGPLLAALGRSCRTPRPAPADLGRLTSVDCPPPHWLRMGSACLPHLCCRLLSSTFTCCLTSCSTPPHPPPKAPLRPPPNTTPPLPPTTCR
jgi:hypothetical protein